MLFTGGYIPRGSGVNASGMPGTPRPNRLRCVGRRGFLEGDDPAVQKPAHHHIESWRLPIGESSTRRHPDARRISCCRRRFAKESFIFCLASESKVGVLITWLVIGHLVERSGLAVTHAELVAIRAKVLMVPSTKCR
jgi:hypothetical protein